MTEAIRKLDQILEDHGAGKSKLTVKTFVVEKEEDPDQTFVLLQGDDESLRFLAETILAHLETNACNLSLHPSGVGRAHFSSDSDVGIYLHLVPCVSH